MTKQSYLQTSSTDFGSAAKLNTNSAIQASAFFSSHCGAAMETPLDLYLASQLEWIIIVGVRRYKTCVSSAYVAGFSSPFNNSVSAVGVRSRSFTFP